MKKIFLLVSIVCAGLLVSFRPADKKGPVLSLSKDDANDKELLGAGATFPYPLYSKMFSEYDKAKGIKVNYQSIGSGGGVKQLQAKTVDFGASDAFLSDEEMKACGAEILHMPTCLGAVVISWNVPGVAKLKMTPEIVSEIFLGTITKWNDPKIVAANKGVKLPGDAIMVVHRSDGSGTTAIFTDYLSKVSPEWKSKVGAGKSVNWPVGLGGKGNEGVAGQIRQTPGAIGYVELIYAAENKMPFADLKNAAGSFITPSLQSTMAAANIELPADTRVSITNSPAKDAYPISGFTWLVIYKEQNYNGRSAAKAKNVLNLLWWVSHDGQQYNESLQYAKLPEKARLKVETILKSATYNGKPILGTN